MRDGQASRCVFDESSIFCATASRSFVFVTGGAAERNDSPDPVSRSLRVMDAVDVDLIHALQVAPRAAAATIGEAIGVSEQTVARRYDALHRGGVLRVVGIVDPGAFGLSEWVARIVCDPDKIDAIAASLVRRSDVGYAHIASAGTELVCVLNTPVTEVQRLDLKGKLARSGGVHQLETSLLMHIFTRSRSEWSAFGRELPAGALDVLSAAAGHPFHGDGHRPTAHRAVDDRDVPLLEALTDDGRASFTTLAESTGSTVARVRRRVRQLEVDGVLSYSVDIMPERLGAMVSATLWMKTTPGGVRTAGQELAGHPEIAFSGALAGEYNLIAVVICADVSALYEYVSTKLAATTGIVQYAMSVRGRRLKQGSSIVAQGRLTPAQADRGRHPRG